jgi:hypothetical protein
MPRGRPQFKFDETITIGQLYKIFSSLDIAEHGYSEFPFVPKWPDDAEPVTQRMFFNVLQKEVYAHRGILLN